MARGEKMQQASLFSVILLHLQPRLVISIVVYVSDWSVGLSVEWRWSEGWQLLTVDILAVHRWRTQPVAISSVICRIQWIITYVNTNGALGFSQWYPSGRKTKKRQQLSFLTSYQTRLPAEFKHINKRRKKTNKDFPDNGEWSGISSNLKSPLLPTANCSFEMRFLGGPKLLGSARHSSTSTSLSFWIFWICS